VSSSSSSSNSPEPGQDKSRQKGDVSPVADPAQPPKARAGLLRSSAITGSMTFVSRMLGLARDVVLAHVFGPGDGSDAFFLAFKIPNFLRRLFAEGAFNQAFVPVLSEYRSQRTLAEVQTLINVVSAYLGTILLLISVVVVAAAGCMANRLRVYRRACKVCVVCGYVAYHLPIPVFDFDDRVCRFNSE
jgi:hypothetical protein